jgi:hypothetical protein
VPYGDLNEAEIIPLVLRIHITSKQICCTVNAIRLVPSNTTRVPFIIMLHINVKCCVCFIFYVNRKKSRRYANSLCAAIFNFMTIPA